MSSPDTPLYPNIPSSFELHGDVIDHVLTHISDFATLAAFTRTSRTVRATYQSHETLIRRAIGYNFCGPHWPIALRAVRARHARDAADADVRIGLQARRREMMGTSVLCVGEPRPDTPCLWISPIVPSVEAMQECFISASDAAALNAMGAGAALLELAYSQRFRNMCSDHSLLSPDQSRRFWRALYMREVFVSAYGIRDRGDFSGRDQEQRQLDMTRFLTAYTGEDFDELWKVEHFVSDIVNWARTAPNNIVRGQLYLAPPNSSSLRMSLIVRLLEMPESRQTGQWPARGECISAFLQKVGEKRKSNSRLDPKLDIFSSPASRPCEHCDVPNIARLYTVSESKWLSGAVSVEMIRIQWIPCFLTENLHLGQTIMDIVAGNGMSGTSILNSVFDWLSNSSDEHKWNCAHRQMCLPCVMRFGAENVLNWCREQLMLRGVHIARHDCPDGWTCKAQTVDEAHAKEMNHICKAS